MNEKALASPKFFYQPQNLFYKLRKILSGTTRSEERNFWTQINVQWKESACVSECDHLKKSENRTDVLLIGFGLFGD